jgi:DNA-binding response OmpR family regulator
MSRGTTIDPIHAPPIATARARKHILVLNSNPDFLDLVRQVLEHASYLATATNFVPRSFEQIAALEPDLLIFDLAIHQQAGWDLLERLAREALTHDLPVIVISTDQALLDRAEREQARYGGRSWIVKPFHIDELLAEIDRLIGPA